MKKLISIIVVVFLIFSLFSDVFADKVNLEREERRGGFLAEFHGFDNPPEIRGTVKRGASSSFEKDLETQLLAHRSPVVVDGWYNYYLSGILKNKILDVLLSNYKIMAYAAFSYRTNAKGQLEITPSYIFDTPEEDEQAREFMEEQIRTEYLEKVEDIPDVVGKMMVIHDLFCTNNEYATEELQANPYNMDIRTAYHLFKNKRAVCQGNAIALKAIYDALSKQLTGGIGEDVIVTDFCAFDDKDTPENDGHIWNVVKVGGEWYHIDETNADYGDYALHNKFLVSSSALRASTSTDFFGPEENWEYYTDSDIVCDDEKYQSGYIFRYNFPFYNISVYNILYEDGRYKLDVYGLDEPFWTNSVISTEVVVSDVYNGGWINYFSENDTDMYQYGVAYNENGSVKDVYQLSPISLHGMKGLAMDYGSFPFEGRLFVWKEIGQVPLCRAIDIP